MQVISHNEYIKTEQTIQLFWRGNTVHELDPPFDTYVEREIKIN